jgi:hypothetical protein
MYNYVEKIGQNFVLSRYMWRKYNQNLKKLSRLDSPEHGKSEKVPLTTAERAKAYTPAEYQYGCFAKPPR